ncbi:MAG: formylglycine-generating enzyme family protein, partial [Proteobacteria bacterium]|nr:formylglycine-generating enzyme family protein [Pseudomonadota bacterium]
YEKFAGALVRGGDLSGAKVFCDGFVLRAEKNSCDRELIDAALDTRQFTELVKLMGVDPEGRWEALHNVAGALTRTGDLLGGARALREADSIDSSKEKGISWVVSSFVPGKRYTEAQALLIQAGYLHDEARLVVMTHLVSQELFEDAAVVYGKPKLESYSVVGALVLKRAYGFQSTSILTIASALERSTDEGLGLAERNRILEQSKRDAEDELRLAGKWFNFAIGLFTLSGLPDLAAEARTLCVKIAKGENICDGTLPSVIKFPAVVPVQNEMVAIPAGTFQMGAMDMTIDEQPVHDVSVNEFKMDKTEVTVAAYEACVKAGKCKPTVTGYKCNSGMESRQNHPINCVDWNQARDYCAWAGKRLPSEEEWEYAARGSDGRTYPWGNTIADNLRTDPHLKDQACWHGNSRFSPDSTCAVGTYPNGASPFGLLDMAGNVWEWTSGVKCKYLSSDCPHASHVFRGGGFTSQTPRNLAAANRDVRGSYNMPQSIGFRCVM